MIRTSGQSGATVAPAGCCAPCAMSCTLIVFVSGRKPFVIPPYTPEPEKRYERIVWTGKGQIYFSEDAALDHHIWFGDWPRENYFGEDPNDAPQPIIDYTDGYGER